jgi:hypothetical protein
VGHGQQQKHLYIDIDIDIVWSLSPLLSSFDHRNYNIDHAYKSNTIVLPSSTDIPLMLVAVAPSSSFHSSFLQFHSIAIGIGIVDTAFTHYK